MKKMMLSLLTVVLAASLAACGQPAAPASASSQQPASSAVESSSEAASSASSEESGEPLSAMAREPLYVADAALFRGVVEDFAVNDKGQTVLQMRRLTGTGYTARLGVALTEDTQYNFDSAQIANGSTLEIFYGMEQGAAETPSEVAAIAVNQLEPEEAVNYNGKLVEVWTDPEREGEGQLRLSSLEGSEVEYVFNFGPETQFYLELAALKPGDLLNIYHTPIMTMSLPPQSPALEVSPYTPPVEGELPVPAEQGTAADFGVPEDAVTYEGKVVSVRIDSTDPLSGAIEMTDMEGGNPYVFNFDAAVLQDGVDVTTLKAGDTLRVQHSRISTRSLPPQSPAYSFAPIDAQ